MHGSAERRKLKRYPGEVAFLDIEGQAYAIIDISPLAVTFETETHKGGDQIRMRIVSALDETDFKEATCRIIRVQETRAAGVFLDQTPEFEKYIIDYIQHHFEKCG